MWNIHWQKWPPVSEGQDGDFDGLSNWVVRRSLSLQKALKGFRTSDSVFFLMHTRKYWNLEWNSSKHNSFSTVKAIHGHQEPPLCSVIHIAIHWFMTNSSMQSLWGFPGGLVVQNLPASAETWVWSLIPEDPTCLGATKPVCHNYWSPRDLEPMLSNKRSPWPWVHCKPCSPQLEKAHTAMKTQHVKKEIPK